MEEVQQKSKNRSQPRRPLVFTRASPTDIAILPIKAEKTKFNAIESLKFPKYTLESFTFYRRSCNSTFEIQKIVETWNSEKGDHEAIVLSSKTAALGLNLQINCFRLCVYSTPENINTLIQIVGRVHRIGQRFKQYIWILTQDSSYDHHPRGHTASRIARFGGVGVNVNDRVAKAICNLIQSCFEIRCWPRQATVKTEIVSRSGGHHVEDVNRAHHFLAWFADHLRKAFRKSTDTKAGRTRQAKFDPAQWSRKNVANATGVKDMPALSVRGEKFGEGWLLLLDAHAISMFKKSAQSSLDMVLFGLEQIFPRFTHICGELKRHLMVEKFLLQVLGESDIANLSDPDVEGSVLSIIYNSAIAHDKQCPETKDVENYSPEEQAYYNTHFAEFIKKYGGRYAKQDISRTQRVFQTYKVRGVAKIFTDAAWGRAAFVLNHFVNIATMHCAEASYSVHFLVLAGHVNDLFPVGVP
ncbi:hypothetical protein LTR70_007747 [Exophiala xenobiotica]|nr:hypothetical protein LTR70_007747 [Exophiala xenobiotica]